MAAPPPILLPHLAVHPLLYTSYETVKATMLASQYADAYTEPDFFPVPFKRKPEEIVVFVMFE
jgi:hypothetical protein